MTIRDSRPPFARRRWAYSLSTVCVAATIAVAGMATPAHAAVPACDTLGWFWPGNESGISLKLPIDTDLKVAYGEWRCIMRYTNIGEDVRTMQEGLNLCYGTNAGINLGINLGLDGRFGPATKAALVKVQRRHRIYADGVYGPQTARTILHKGDALTPYGTYDVCATTTQAGVN